MSLSPQSSFGANAVVVNRTHRIVREQAAAMRSQREKSRSFIAPIVICSLLMAVACYAVWALLDGYDMTPSGIPDASDQMFIFMLWSLPVSAALLAFAWLRRGRSRQQNEVQP